MMLMAQLTEVLEQITFNRNKNVTNKQLYYFYLTVYKYQKLYCGLSHIQTKIINMAHELLDSFNIQCG